MKRLLILMALLFGIISAAFWGGVQWSKGSRRALVEHQAIWLARMWSDDQTLDQICQAAAETGNTPVFRDEWDAGSGEILAFGPVVSGERVYVRKDRAVRWRAAR
ncbi:hypothetical protein OKA04_10895 [Luteolibacter flavescens]|uniref:DUF2845 domain-containing protein n=1 Tax=Luteolibacter flavescens TaxID=1859460 RepID=A0ABT3FNT0_9BACT|nr:hypothetical protein [Luteolibacter flavescens]MCW1885236.1 hypothetical protein [Luteolibacter flavescens]